jgi:hypothetical protein
MATPEKVKIPKHTRGDSARLTFNLTTDADLTNCTAKMTFRKNSATGAIVKTLDSEAGTPTLTVSNSPKKVVTSVFSIDVVGQIYWDLELVNNDWDLPKVTPYAGVWQITQDQTP